MTHSIHTVQGLGAESTELGLNENGSDVQYMGKGRKI